MGLSAFLSEHHVQSNVHVCPQKICSECNISSIIFIKNGESKIYSGFFILLLCLLAKLSCQFSGPEEVVAVLSYHPFLRSS